MKPWGRTKLEWILIVLLVVLFPLALFGGGMVYEVLIYMGD